jgi:uncharacterized membrane protein YuzA (DUF378 family)
LIIKNERRYKMMHILRMVAYALVITGAIVWGIVGFFGYNIVSAIFGDMSILSRIVYALVGLSAIVLLVTRPEEAFCNCSETTRY